MRLLEDATIIRRFDKTKFPPARFETAGNRAGAPRFMIKLGTPQEHETGASGRYDMKAGGAIFCCRPQAGAATVIPRKRAREAVLQDIAEGYVSRDAAAKLYGQDVLTPLRKGDAPNMEQVGVIGVGADGFGRWSNI